MKCNFEDVTAVSVDHNYEKGGNTFAKCLNKVPDSDDEDDLICPSKKSRSS